MLQRRQLLGSLLFTPAIVHHASLMKLALPRYYGFPIFTSDGELRFTKVGEALADFLTDPPILCGERGIHLPAWNAVLRSGLAHKKSVDELIRLTPAPFN